MIEPSQEWTQEERNKVMLEIVRGMHPRTGTGLALPTKLPDTLERLNFLLTASAEFLEENRDHILNSHS